MTSKGDYSIVAYKSLRLPFGLISSPFLLMLDLHKILIVDQTGDNKFDNINKCIYSFMYMDMDNGSYTTNDLEQRFPKWVPRNPRVPQYLARGSSHFHKN